MNPDTLATSLNHRVISFTQKPYPYRTSHHLDELDVELDGGAQLKLLLKDLSRTNLVSDAKRAKPEFLHNPMREAEAYHLLADTDLGAPILYASGHDWLLLEKVPGRELWQSADVRTWAAAARWAARLHECFASRPPSANHLLRYDATFFGLWPERAHMLHPEIKPIVARYNRVIEILATLPVTMIHGEFYPSNILVGAQERISPVDWEMSGVGPGVLDIAALASGWAEPEATAILDAYGAVTNDALEAARIHLSLQWLGWSEDWTPPPEHARDWLDEAMRAAEKLGL